MALELASLVTRLKLDSKQFKSELAAAKDSTQKLRLGMAALGAAAAASAIVLAGKSVKAAQEWGGEVRGLTRELGISAQAASGLAFAAEHLGIPVETLSKSFGIFAKNVVTNNKALAANGIVTRDAQGRTLSFQAVLGGVADKFKAMPDGINKTALALQLFGRGGKALIPLLNQGSAGLKELAAEAAKFGLVLTADNIEALKKLKFAQRDLSASFKGFEVQLGLKLTPLATAFAQVLTKLGLILDHLPPGVVAGTVVLTALGGAMLAVTSIAAAAKRNFTELFGATEANTAAAEKSAAANQAEAGSLGEVTAAEEGAAAATTGATAAQEAQTAATTTAAGSLKRFAGTVTLYGAIIYAGAKATAFFAQKIDEIQRGKAHPQALAVALGNLASGGNDVARVFSKARISLSGLSDEIRDAGKNVSYFGAVGRIAARILPIGFDAAKKHLDDLDKALAKMVNDGNAAGAVRAFTLINKTLKLTPKDAAHFLDDYTRALKDAGGEAGAGADALDTYRLSLEENIQAQQDFAALLDKGVPQGFIDSLKAQGEQGVSVAEALVGSSKEVRDQFVKLFQDSLPAVAKQVHTFAGLTGDEFTQWRIGISNNADLVETSLEDLAGKAHLTARAILKTFQDQVKAERDAERNARLVFANLPDTLPVEEFKKKLAEMGPQQAAPILKALADALTSGNKKVFDAIIANITASDQLGRAWGNIVGPAADRLSKGALKNLDDTLKGLKLNSNIRTQVEALVKDDPHIPIRDLDAILRDLGVRKSIRTKIEAAVKAAVQAHIVKVTGTAHFVSPGGSRGTFKFYREGGYTGAGPANGFPIIAHPKEYVLPAAAVGALGLPLLEGLRRIRRHDDLFKLIRLQQFQAGGLVTYRPPSTASAARSAQMPAPAVVSNTTKNITFTITNPKPAAAEDTIERQLRNLVYLGVL